LFTELLLAGFEHPAHVVGPGDVGLHRNRLAAGCLQFSNQSVGFPGTGGVVDDHGEAVAGETPGNCCSNAARGAGDDGDLGVVCAIHDSFPQGK
jgi:hypothetical protein